MNSPGDYTLVALYDLLDQAKNDGSIIRCCPLGQLLPGSEFYIIWPCDQLNVLNLTVRDCKGMPSFLKPLVGKTSKHLRHKVAWGTEDAFGSMVAVCIVMPWCRIVSLPATIRVIEVPKLADQMAAERDRRIEQLSDAVDRFNVLLNSQLPKPHLSPLSPVGWPKTTGQAVPWREEEQMPRVPGMSSLCTSRKDSNLVGDVGSAGISNAPVEPQVKKDGDAHVRKIREAFKMLEGRIRDLCFGDCGSDDRMPAGAGKGSDADDRTEPVGSALGAGKGPQR